MTKASTLLRPADVCAALLAALDAADGRTRTRKRDQTPDIIGLACKRELLRCIVLDDPEPMHLEAWLLRYVQAREAAPGAVLAMARSVLEEWRLAHDMGAFAAWLAQGAPSADANVGGNAAATQATKRGEP